MPRQSLLRKCLSRSLSLCLAALVATAAIADEAVLKRTIEAKLQAKTGRKAAVTSVTRTQYGGLYEVFAGNSVYYTDEKFSFLIEGALYDTGNWTNVTEERLGKLTAIKFAELPLANAIVTKRGNGKRVLATFEDPNCGYCKVLLRDLSRIDNLTVYTFLVPILSEDSAEKSRRIWCAPDKSKAWAEWMLEGKLPASGTCNTGVLEKNQELAVRLNVRGTPTIFFTDGSRAPGALPKAELERRLQVQGN